MQLSGVLTGVISIIIFVVILRIYFKLCLRKCKCKTSMVGKVVVVTGANSGIGYHTANKLAEKGAKVILACRNESRGLKAADDIKTATGNSQVIFRHLDLTSLKSIKDFAIELVKTEQRLDVLVNNAGACALQNKYTDDGIIEGMQVNHFGPFLLTLNLLPLLKRSRSSRIVNVSSLIYLFGLPKLNKINDRRLNRIILYADSKYCNLVMQQEWARRLEEMDIVVNSMHPGMILTNILGESNPLFGVIFKFLCWVNSRTAADGAETVVHLAVAEECGRVTGRFYIDCKDRYLLPKARDPELAKKLWSLSEEVVEDYL